MYQTPICSSPCQNGGTCSGTNTCSGCNPGWTGVQCQTTTPPAQFVAVGSGTNTISWSNDGIVWHGLGTTTFSGYGSDVEWNGAMWVAVGYGTNAASNNLAWSYDGKVWTGATTSSGNPIFSTYGSAVTWNNSMWISLGNGTNTIAYSHDGKVWTGLGTSIFGSFGSDVVWNGSMWVAVGCPPTNSIAWSTDGIEWHGLGTGIFSSYGVAVAWNGSLWVAVGVGSPTSNSIAWSTDGISWTGLGTSLLTSGADIAWNGVIWVAVGNSNSSSTIAWSTDGKTWTGATNSNGGGNSLTIFSHGCNAVAWNGSIWVAVGSGSTPFSASTYSIAWSTDGRVWTPVVNSFSISAALTAVAWSDSTATWVAMGNGPPNSIVYSTDGKVWTAVTNSTSIFSITGNAVAAALTATCASACQNGGTCWSPNTCTCVAGWEGAQCQTAFCDPRLKSIVLVNTQGVPLVPKLVEWYNPGSAVATAFGTEIPDTIFNPLLIPVGYECDWMPLTANPACYTFNAEGWNGTATAPTFKVTLAQPTDIGRIAVTVYAGSSTRTFKVTLYYEKDNKLTEYIYSSSGAVVTVFVRVQLSCNAGWTGDQCQMPVCDEGHACVNGGTCSSPNKCSNCNPGWTGDQCQTSQCASIPCVNGGTCSGLNKCSNCNTGWTGDQCQTPVCDEGHACVNGGTCSSPNKCSCNPGWTGDQCQTSQCASIPCVNGGTCSGLNTCSNCNTGWSGTQCQMPVCDEGHACVNGGKCSSPNKCSNCNPGWTGDQCQTAPVSGRIPFTVDGSNGFKAAYANSTNPNAPGYAISQTFGDLNRYGYWWLFDYALCTASGDGCWWSPTPNNGAWPPGQWQASFNGPVFRLDFKNSTVLTEFKALGAYYWAPISLSYDIAGLQPVTYPTQPVSTIYVQMSCANQPAGCGVNPGWPWAPMLRELQLFGYTL